ncbi:MAG: hypothetical protein RLZZ194_762, partial [Actinomycetota bacterium]
KVIKKGRYALKQGVSPFKTREEVLDSIIIGETRGC